jgi:hypothetical protein
MPHDAFGDGGALYAIFHPKTIAVIGSTAEPDSLGVEQPAIRDVSINPLLASTEGTFRGGGASARRGIHAKSLTSFSFWAD